jgi:predicted NACHT family NTPase
VAAERIELAADFFDPYLESGRAAILLDGLDEVADPHLRRRVSRMVEFSPPQVRARQTAASAVAR